MLAIQIYRYIKHVATLQAGELLLNVRPSKQAAVLAEAAAAAASASKQAAVLAEAAAAAANGAAAGTAVVAKVHPQPSPWSKFKSLLSRNILNTKRDFMLTKVRFGQTIFIGLIIGVLFFQLDRNMLGVRNRAGVVFMISMTQVLVF